MEEKEFLLNKRNKDPVSSTEKPNGHLKITVKKVVSKIPDTKINN
jgi:hypothetical protein